MSRRVIGYVVRAYRSDGQVDEYPFNGTGWETLQKVQDKQRELEGQKDAGAGITAIHPGALYADQLPPPQPRSQVTRHQREID